MIKVKRVAIFLVTLFCVSGIYAQDGDFTLSSPENGTYEMHFEGDTVIYYTVPSRVKHHDVYVDFGTKNSKDSLTASFFINPVDSVPLIVNNAEESQPYYTVDYYPYPILRNQTDSMPALKYISLPVYHHAGYHFQTATFSTSAGDGAIYFRSVILPEYLHIENLTVYKKDWKRGETYEDAVMIENRGDETLKISAEGEGEIFKVIKSKRLKVKPHSSIYVAIHSTPVTVGNLSERLVMKFKPKKKKKKGSLEKPVIAEYKIWGTVVE